MPRKALGLEEELRALKEKLPVLEENERMAHRAVTANLARQKEIKDEIQHKNRQKIGAEVDGFGLTREEILEALAAKKREVERGTEDVIAGVDVRGLGEPSALGS